MKTQFSRILKSKANALLVTIIMMAVLTLTIGGYLQYVQQQTKLGARSQQWNAAMAISEAGIEEGLEALNNGGVSAMTSANNWSSPSANIYVLGPRTLLNGYYYVTNDMSDPTQPTLTSRGYVNVSTYSKLWSQSPLFLATAGISATPPTRAVKVTTSKGSMILAAMVAKHTIDMNGNWGMTDSFDSGFPGSKSTLSGLYAAQYSSTNGDVASIDGFVSAGNFTIKGDVATGPNGTVTLGSQGQITGTITHDANYTFPQNTFPYTSGICPAGGTNLTVIGTSTNSVTYTNSTTPPPAPGANQTIVAVTNISTPVTSVYPGDQINLKTNTTTSITGTNKTLTIISSNLVCSSTTFNSNTLPANACSYVTQGNGNGAVSYKNITTIVGTNIVYQTNLVYTYTTNTTYTYTLYTYTYTIYTGTVLYQTNIYDHILCGDTYFCPNGLSGNTLVSCPSRLVMTNGWQMSGSDIVTIAPGASLTNYVGGDTLAITGNGIVNKNGLAQSLVVIGADSVKTMKLDISGNGSFTGVLVAPNADVQLNGGGNSSTNDFVGSLMANSIKMNGHFQFHYDEALSRIGGGGRYLITSWREIP